MRTVWITIGLVLVLVILVFVFQNTGPVEVHFFTGSLTAPLALIASAVYVLGMLTGSTFFAALRRSYRETQRRSN